MKKTLLTLATTLGLSFATFASADTVRLATEGAYPPFNFINDDGEIDGFEREFGDALCDVAELDCVWVKNDWDSIIPNLVNGNYDVILAGMSITDERKEVIDFTQYYVPPEPSRYVALAGTNADILAEGIIAAQTATIQAGHVADSKATLVEFASPDETVAAVRNGEVDAVLADAAFLEDAVSTSNDLAIIGEPVYLGDGVGAGLRQSDTELKATLNQAIEQMKEDGTLDAMLAKWFPDDDADTGAEDTAAEDSETAAE